MAKLVILGVSICGLIIAIYAAIEIAEIDRRIEQCRTDLEHLLP